MTERVFVDTNVVVYAADPAAPRKQRRAAVVMEQVFASPVATISTQVMQEFYAVATRGSRPRMKHDVVAHGLILGSHPQWRQQEDGTDHPCHTARHPGVPVTVEARLQWSTGGTMDRRLQKPGVHPPGAERR